MEDGMLTFDVNNFVEINNFQIKSWANPQKIIIIQTILLILLLITEHK